MAYVRVGGGGGIDPTTYLASLPTYILYTNSYTCRGAGCTWQEGSGGGGGIGAQTLCCDGKVTIIASYGARFDLTHISDGTVESIMGGTRTFYFQAGDKYSAVVTSGAPSGSGSVNATWSEA